MENKPIAIVGMDCVFPGAPDLFSFWKNILSGKDLICPIPKERDLNRTLPGEDESDRIFCTHGAFLETRPFFSPIDYGVMPGVCEKVDPEQLLVFQTTDRALKDAGIDAVKEDLKRTDIILGRGGYLGNSLQQLHCRTEVIPSVLGILRDMHPDIDDATLSAVRSEMRSCFKHLNSDVIPFGIPNIITGRIANRYNMMGTNFTVDAACASTLLAVENSIISLRRGNCDKAVTGGVFLANNPGFWWTFSKIEAISKSNRIMPFSADADGMLVGEGVGILILERLDDAVAAGRRIYAVIKGAGSASDGRGSALLAPRKEGQIECLKRAYNDANLSPDSIDLIEGHGTGTVAGDQVELSTIKEFFGSDADGVPVRALGSIKSMIGHTMPAAGAASLIKTALSLYHKILPPTLHGDKPSPILKGSSCYLNTVTRPWVHPPLTPRRAGINCFGFGGINGHVVLEEYDSSGLLITDQALKWPSEIFAFNGKSIKSIYDKIITFKETLIEKGKDVPNLDVLSHGAAKLWKSGDAHNLSIVANDHDDLNKKLLFAGQCIENEHLGKIKEIDGIYYETAPLGANGKITFIFPGNAFPGLGDDYTERLAELSLYMPCFRVWFDLLDQGRNDGARPYRFSSMLFTPPGLNTKRFVSLKKELRLLANSADGVFIANAASLDLMYNLGVHPHMVTGTSLGEWSALMAGGIIDFNDVAALGVQTVRLKDGDIKGAMGLAQCSHEDIYSLMEEVNSLGIGSVSCSLDLSPCQVIFGGDREAVAELSLRISRSGIWSEHLNLIPIHTPCCEPIASIQRDVLKKLKIFPQKIPVYSGSTAAPYPEDPEEARALLANNTILPVRMRELFERLYEDDVRIFIQLGGGGKVLRPIEETLEGRPFLSMAMDVSNRHPVSQLQHLAANLIAHGIAVDLDLFYRYRLSSIINKKELNKKKSDYAVKLNMSVPKFHVKTHVKSKSEKYDNIRNEKIKNLRVTPESIIARQMGFASRIINLHARENLTESRFLMEAMQQQCDLLLGTRRDAINTSLNEPASFSRELEASLPFVDRVIEYTPHDKVVIERTLSLKEDLFLKDHAFIPCPDHIKPAEERFPAVPMAVSLEIIAQAAKMLYPDKDVTGFLNIKNSSWIPLDNDNPSLVLTVTAKQSLDESGKKTAVCKIESKLDPDTPHITGIVIMGYPDDDRKFYDNSDIGESKPCTLDPESLYRPGGLYHGPCFQGLYSLERAGKGGIDGILTAPDITGFFKNRKPDAMLCAPGVIDAASQLIACWAIETLNKYIWVAPVGIKKILILSENPLPGEKVKARLVIKKFEARIVEFDIFLKGKSGLWMVIRGWQDWKMKWTEMFFDFWKSPANHLLSAKIDVHKDETTGLFDDLKIFQADIKNISGVSPEWVARLYLNTAEWTEWLKQGENKRLPWLLGRIAAKDAVRDFLSGSGIYFYPSQIQISKNGSGQPVAGFQPGTGIEMSPPLISISHKSDMGVAVLVPGNDKMPGIDIEEIDRKITTRFLDQAFESNELEILKQGSSDISSVNVLKGWCAKKATAKAAGAADFFHPKKFSIKSFDDLSGVIALSRLDGKKEVNVLTMVKGKKIFALCQIVAD